MLAASLLKRFNTKINAKIVPGSRYFFRNIVLFYKKNNYIKIQVKWRMKKLKRSENELLIRYMKNVLNEMNRRLKRIENT